MKEWTNSSGRTAQQQLATLDHRLGKNIGASKERARLNAIIAAANVKEEKK